jgi:hypothetical protein
MTDRPVFIPTAAGPVGAVVSHPGTPPSACVVIVGGIGGRRSGINRLWTRTAWDLAREGFAVLRMDYPGRGESALAAPKPSTDALIAASSKWFLGTVPELDVHLVAACYASRIVPALADGVPVASVTMVSPYVRRLPPEPRSRSRVARRLSRVMHRAVSPRIDRPLFDALATVARRARTVAIVGELDPLLPDVRALHEHIRQVNPEGQGLDVDVVPGMALHESMGAAQDQTIAHVVGWVTARGAQPAKSSRVPGEGLRT